jgi:hypothetical protein
VVFFSLLSHEVTPKGRLYLLQEAEAARVEKCAPYVGYFAENSIKKAPRELKEVVNVVGGCCKCKSKPHENKSKP